MTLDDPLTTPPKGALTLGVARHITQVYGDESIEFHRERAQLVHQLEGQASLEIIDWGRTDREDPANEIVEVVIKLAALAIEAFGQIVAGWIGRPRTKKDAEPTVLGIAIRTPEGMQVTFDYRGYGDPVALAQALIAVLKPLVSTAS